MDEAELLGMWGQEGLVYSGDMQENAVFFAPTGEGVYEWSRPGRLMGAVFTWALVGDLLVTRTVRSFQSPIGKLRPLRRGGGTRFDHRARRVSIAEETLVNDKRGRVLRLTAVPPDWRAFGLHPHQEIFGYVTSTCPEDLAEQIQQAHRYFDRRGGLPRPRLP